METIVFHSIKGGAGRSLSLLNIASLLAKAEKTVLVLDWDYLAPGLHLKWNSAKPKELIELDCGKEGYTEYLQKFSPEDRCDQSKESQRSRRKWLFNHLSKCSNHLYFLHCGNELSKNYWDYIETYKFQSLFYFEEEQLKGLSRQSFPEGREVLNIQAFLEDLEIIKSLLPGGRQFDYFLVDCKSSYDPAKVIINIWADKIAHFLPYNPEGIFYENRFYHAVQRYFKNIYSNSELNKSADYFVVIARTDDYEIETHEQVIRDAGNNNKVRYIEYEQSLRQRASETGLRFNENNIVRLPECHELRMDQEKILLALEHLPNDNYTNTTKWWLLSHGYIELIAKLTRSSLAAMPSKLPNDTDKSHHVAERFAENWWYSLAGFDGSKRIVSKVFERNSAMGNLINSSDNQPNIAFRVDTLRLLLYCVYEQLEIKNISKDDAKQIFLIAGYKCGEGFATEFTPALENKLSISDGKVKANLEKYIEEWANFDSNTGFGNIELLSISFEPLEIKLAVTGGAFHQEDEINSDIPAEINTILTSFFCGYASGVLSHFHDAKIAIEATGKSESQGAKSSCYLYTAFVE